jgi:carbamoyltransferase
MNNSLGDLYRVTTEVVGFGFLQAGKTMGLSSYGDERYVTDILSHVTLEPEGKFTIRIGGENGLLFNLKSLRERELKRHRRFEVDAAIAYAGQYVLEEVLFHILAYLRSVVDSPYLCVSGGVALNSLAMGKIINRSDFRDVYVHFSSGDSGTAIGAAIMGLQQKNSNKSTHNVFKGNPYLGKEYGNDYILKLLKSNGISFTRPINIHKTTARLIESGKIVAWYQGASEFGPRALGNRSLLADCRQLKNRDHLNARIKMREWFRPLAPSVISNKANTYFDLDCNSPFMQFVWPVKESYQSKLPAIVHVDGGSRIQTVSEKDNPDYFALIHEFEELSQIPILLNTSFNTFGEPIVETPEEALSTFLNSDIDCLVLGSFLVERS